MWLPGGGSCFTSVSLAIRLCSNWYLKLGNPGCIPMASKRPKAINAIRLAHNRIFFNRWAEATKSALRASKGHSFFYLLDTCSTWTPIWPLARLNAQLEKSCGWRGWAFHCWLKVSNVTDSSVYFPNLNLASTSLVLDPHPPYFQMPQSCLGRLSLPKEKASEG